MPLGAVARNHRPPQPRRHGAPTQRIPGATGELSPWPSPRALRLPVVRSRCLQTTLAPAQAVAVLNDRVRHVSQLHIHIADWLQVGAVLRQRATLDPRP